MIRKMEYLAYKRDNLSLDPWYQHESQVCPHASVTLVLEWWEQADL